MDAQAFVVDLDDGSCVDGEEAVGLDRGKAVRARLRRFCALKGYLAPPTVLPIRDNFLGILGRRVRRLVLTDAQNRSYLSRGADFRAALKVSRNADPDVLVQVRQG